MRTICRGCKCAVYMTNQGGRFCLVAFPKKPVNFNLGYLAVSTFIFMKSVGKEGMLLTELRLFFCNEAG
jgi:L-iditol 2-dehydrogenase